MPDPTPIRRPCHMTLQEVADRFDVSRRTVTKWVASGALRVIRLSPRLIRVSEEDFQAFRARARAAAVRA